MLEKRVMDDSNTGNIQAIVGHVNEILNIVDLYESSRPGSMVVTKLEEAVMWAQSMMSNIPLRKEVVTPVDENKDEINTAA